MKGAVGLGRQRGWGHQAAWESQIQPAFAFVSPSDTEAARGVYFKSGMIGNPPGLQEAACGSLRYRPGVYDSAARESSPIGWRQPIEHILTLGDRD